MLGEWEHKAGSRDGGQETVTWIQEVDVESGAETLARGTGRSSQIWETLHESRGQDVVTKGQSVTLF